MRGPGRTKAWTPSSARSTRSPAGAAPTTCSWPRAAPPTAPVETAARLARDRARVVDIGKTKLDLPWNAYYDKELDVRFSRSYGPGRYDDRYELEGIDYPVGYVRWTERRNLECFLDLIARKELEVETLVSGVFPMRERGHRLCGPGLRRAEGRRASCSSTRRRPEDARRGPRASLVRAAPAGATRRRTGGPSVWRSGSSARATTPPRCCCRTWPGCPDVQLAHVATTRSLSAVNAQRRFGFTTASTSAGRRARGRSRWTRSSS